MASEPRPFPTSGVLPEERQIGRRAAIDGLERQVVSGRQHSWLTSERRTGKSSVAEAVLTRRRRSGEWSLRVDLKYRQVATPEQFAEAIAREASGAGIQITPAKTRLMRGARAVARGGDRLGAAAKGLGLDEGADLKSASDAISAALGSDGSGPSLAEVLAAIQTAAVVEERLVVLFVDEIQELSKWSDQAQSLIVQEQLSKLINQPEGGAVLILAGSDGDAVAALRQSGKPLHFDGITYDLPQISEEDWWHGLSARFAEIDVSIERRQVGDILEASGGHPLRTMQVCAQLETIMGSDPVVLDPFVVEAISIARKHPSWKT
jgi:hypothetical protein